MNEHLVINEAGLALIKKWEGLMLKAYICPANKITIGFGATFYENGKSIKITDVITKERADELLMFHVEAIGSKIKKLLKKEINQNQYNALISWVYNLGIGNLQTSTLLKKINLNPNDESIREEFVKWKFANGKIIDGLLKRRLAEINLYFKPC